MEGFSCILLIISYFIKLYFSIRRILFSLKDTVICSLKVE